MEQKGELRHRPGSFHGTSSDGIRGQADTDKLTLALSVWNVPMQLSHADRIIPPFLT